MISWNAVNVQFTLDAQLKMKNQWKRASTVTRHDDAWEIVSRRYVHKVCTQKKNRSKSSTWSLNANLHKSTSLHTKKKPPKLSYLNLLDLETKKTDGRFTFFSENRCFFLSFSSLTPSFSKTRCP